MRWFAAGSRCPTSIAVDGLGVGSVEASCVALRCRRSGCLEASGGIDGFAWASAGGSFIIAARNATPSVLESSARQETWARRPG